MCNCDFYYAGLILQRHHYLAAHPAAVWGRSGPGSPGGSGSGPERSRTDSTERAAGQPGDLPHPGPNCHRYRTDPVADFPGNLQRACRTFPRVSKQQSDLQTYNFNKHFVFLCCERCQINICPVCFCRFRVFSRSRASSCRRGKDRPSS